MAMVKMDRICEHMHYDLRRAIANAVRSAIADAEFDESGLFYEFVREVRIQCGVRQTVPDDCVDTHGSDA